MEVCACCETSSVDRHLGPFVQLSGYYFHSKCVIFSTVIRKDEDGTGELFEFDIETIKNAVNRRRERICAICGKKGATIGCREDDCETTFHLPCALKFNQTLHSNFNNFASFCPSHIPDCMFDFEPIVEILNKKSDCCKRINFTRDKCVEKHVEKSKSQSKCPFCSNVKDFRNEIETNMTLNIPNGSPTYAQKQNFQYVLKCSSISRLCLGGVFFHKANTDFDLVGCENCGFDAIHRIRVNVELDLDYESYEKSSNPESRIRKRKRKSENLGPNKKVARKIEPIVKKLRIPLEKISPSELQASKIKRRQKYEFASAFP